MKTKRKKKRSEKKKIMCGMELGTFDVPGLNFIARPRGTRKQSEGNFIIKTFKPY